MFISPFYRGDTKLVKLRFRDANDEPVDITGWILWLTFKTDPTAADNDSGAAQVRANLAIADTEGLIYRNLDAVNGLVTLRVGPELTSRLTGGETYHVDLRKTVPITHVAAGPTTIYDSQDNTTLLSDTVPVLDDVTRQWALGTAGEEYVPE